MRMMAMESLLTALPGAHDQRAQLLKMVRLVTPRNDDDVVEAELAQAVQPLAGRLPRALQVARIVRAIGARRLAQMLDHVRDASSPTAETAKPLAPLAQEPPVAPGARSDPAVDLAGRPLDPARARPRADQHGRPAEGIGPHRRQRGGADALAGPEPPHGRERLVHAPKARGEVEAERLEVSGSRPRPHAEPHPATRHQMSRQHALRELHRIT